MPCEGTGYGDMAATDGQLTLPRNVAWETLIASGPHLIVSNHPETISGAAQRAAETLYKVEIEIENGSLVVRVFLWHGHNRNSVEYLHLILEAVGGTVVISNHQLISKQGHLNELDKPGKCCAKGHVIPSLDPYINGNVTLLAGQQKSVKHYAIPVPFSPGVPYYQGAVHEFTATTTDDASLRVRTALARNATDNPTNIGSYADDPVDSGDTHPRGHWEYSNLDLHIVNPIDVQTETSFYVAFGHETGIDSQKFAIQPGDTWGTPPTGNKGLYGVNATYYVPLIGGATATTVSRKLKPGGGKYWGAMAQNPPGIPALRIEPPEGPEYVNFGTVQVGHLGVVKIRTNAVGGAAATPVNLIFTW